MHNGVPYRSIDQNIRELCVAVNHNPRLRTVCSCEGHLPPRGDHQSHTAYVTMSLTDPTKRDYQFLHTLGAMHAPLKSPEAIAAGAEVRVDVWLMDGDHGEWPEVRVGCDVRSERGIPLDSKRGRAIAGEANEAFIHFATHQFERYNARYIVK